MIDRPEQPPQVIKAGDLYSGDVQIFLDGELSYHWKFVSAVEGWGVRYKSDENGRFIYDGDEMAVETVYGSFEVKWTDK